MPLTLLTVFAHPDDESFACGGTLSRYASQGVRVVSICATRGEVGMISDPALATRETLGQVREEELREASRVLGVDELQFLGYLDSGMEGTAENRDPRALAQADPQAVIGALVQQIRRLRPQIVITFDQEGIYGHPDHKAVHRYTTEAFQAAGDPTVYPDMGPPFAPQRLYYATVPRSAFQRMAQAMAEHGVRLEEQGFQPETMGVPDEQITHTADIRPFLDVKLRAIRSHRTQMAEDNPINALPKDVMERFFSQEYFIQGSPSPSQQPVSDELLKGIIEE